MPDFPLIRLMLRTTFNAEDGLDEALSVSLYQANTRSAEIRSRLLPELERAFSDTRVSWRELLCNEDYEVVDVETEDEARAQARRWLWDPLFETSREARDDDR